MILRGARPQLEELARMIRACEQEAEARFQFETVASQWGEQKIASFVIELGRALSIAWGDLEGFVDFWAECATPNARLGLAVNTFVVEIARGGGLPTECEPMELLEKCAQLTPNSLIEYAEKVSDLKIELARLCTKLSERALFCMPSVYAQIKGFVTKFNKHAKTALKSDAGGDTSGLQAVLEEMS